MMDFLVLGVLYGLSLPLVHQLLWEVGPGLGEHPPQAAVDFANQFSGVWHDLALRGYTSVIALVIRVGTGLVIALVAVGAHQWHVRRASNA